MSAPPARSTLHANGLQCVRGDRRVFDGVAFDLTNGGLLQVSGPNGSGKTSLLRIVCGLLQPAAGSIEWNGHAIRALGEDFNRNLAYVGHLNAVKDELRVGENLRLGARLAGVPATDEAILATLHEFAFRGLENLPCKFLSLGQKRRLALARLRLSWARALWVLDEPFAALDAAGVGVVKLVLEQHLQRGGVALLTTHQEVAIAAPTLQRIELGE
jgi:heme exporter protein A